MGNGVNGIRYTARSYMINELQEEIVLAKAAYQGTITYAANADPTGRCVQ